VGKWDESNFWITGYRGFAAAALKFKYSGAMNRLAAPLAAALFARDLFRNRNWQSTSRKLELCAGFDSRFDTFWNDFRAQNSSMLLAVRSGEILHWHFEHSLRDGRVWVLSESLGNRIRAYAIFYRRDNPALGLNRVRLIDYQSLDRTVDALPAMLAWAIRQAGSSGVHVVENVGFRPYGTRIIEERAPYRRKLPSWLYFYKTRDQAIQRRLADPAVWNPSWFDGDASL
jgi:hypothetical protein